MSKKKTIFVRVLGGVADVDLATVPEGVEVEIVDLDDLEAAGAEYRKTLSAAARQYAKAKGYI